MLKAAWFKDTPKLLELNLANNRINKIEMEFVKSVPALINLDLRGNELTTLPNDFIKQLPSTLLHMNLYSNPLNYRQMHEITEWGKSKEDKMNEPKMKELKHVLGITKTCLDDKNIIDKTNEAIDKCVEDKMKADVAAVAKS